MDSQSHTGFGICGKYGRFGMNGASHLPPCHPFTTAMDVHIGLASRGFLVKPWHAYEEAIFKVRS